jgi:hypothetical protein
MIFFNLFEVNDFALTIFYLGHACRCAILIVSHGDTLQILQTLLQKFKDESSLDKDFESRIKNFIVNTVLSQHRKFALLTGELRQLI